MVYKRIIGTRAEVWHGTAKKTSGGLTKKHLMMNKHGRIVSRTKHSTAKREMRLLKHGYGTKRGKFGYVKMGTKRRGKMRGGSGGIAYGSNGSSPAMYNAHAPIMGKMMPGMSGNGIDGQGITMYSGDSVQLAAGQAGGRRRRMRRQRGGGVVYGANGNSPAMYNAHAPIMGKMMPGMSGNGIDGQGITMYSGDSVQLAAGQAGGRRRRRSRGHRGGTTMPIPSQNPGSPLNMALGAGAS